MLIKQRKLCEELARERFRLISFWGACCQEKQQEEEKEEEEEQPRKRGCEKLHNLGRVQNNWKAGKVEVEALIRQGERCEAK